MKRLTAFLLPFILCTITAWSAESELQTVYLKEQSFAYLYPFAKEEYAAAVYGKGEAVQSVGWEQGCCIIRHLGQKLYLPKSAVTAKKPRWSFHADNTHRKLTLQENSVLYLQPSKSAEKMVCKERTLYTVGETKRWYKLYTEGKTAFIPKDSRRILKCEKAVFPKIIISVPNKDRYYTERIQYFYSLIPERARKMAGKNLTICITDEFEREFEMMGAGAYARSDGNIYLKADGGKGMVGIVEQCLIHELGHMVQYSLREKGEDIFKQAAVLMKSSTLELRQHHQSEREYLAETFELYVKMPDRLKKQAPETWKYFSDLFYQ